jgi:acyl-CoA thioesterase
MFSDPSAPIFARSSDGRFAPTALAGGPFDGLQGGGVAALVAGTIEKVAAADGWPTTVFAHFLRPVASTTLLEVRVQCVRRGRRVSVWEGSLHDSSHECARVRITFIKPRLLAGIERSSTGTIFGDPNQLPARHWKSPQGGPWLLDAMDVRGPADGVYWMRMRRALFDEPTVLSWILPPADCAHGLEWTLAGWPLPIRALPNPDIALHLLRLPRSRWIGVRPSALHGDDGIGACQAMLFDQAGSLGSTSMSIAIS